MSLNITNQQKKVYNIFRLFLSDDEQVPELYYKVPVGGCWIKGVNTKGMEVYTQV